MGFPDGSDGKETSCNAGEPGSIPGLGRFPGESNGYPLQWRNLWTKEPGELQSMGLQRLRNNWATKTHTHTHTHTQSHGLFSVINSATINTLIHVSWYFCVSFSKIYINVAVDIGLLITMKLCILIFPK